MAEGNGRRRGGAPTLVRRPPLHDGARPSRPPVRREQAVAARALSQPGEELRQQLRWPLWLSVGAAHFVGGVLTFAILTFIIPRPNDLPGVTALNVSVAIPFMLVAMVAGRLISGAVLKPVTDWLVADRPPDRREVDLTLRQPQRQALACGGIWVLAALLFGALNVSTSVTLAAEAAAMIFDAGVVTCSISYLLVERAMRPVTARALAFGQPDRPLVPGVSRRLLWAWMLSTGVLLTWIATISAAVLAGVPASLDRLAVTSLVLALLAQAVGITAILVAARSVADPLQSVRRALEEVEQGNLEVEAPVYDGSEVGLLQAGFNRMVAGLREREQLRDLFGRHVGEDVARQALDRGLELGGELREVAILFADLIGSTRLAATRDPREVVGAVNAFFAIVVEEVSVHGGWVNKFEGDGALCVFGAPTAHPDPAGSALATARALHARLRRELPEVQAAIGLSAGPVVAGNVGAAERFEYTVIGDPVNEAARLTDLAKSEPGHLLAAEAIVGRAGAAETPHWELGDSVTLRGRAAPTRLARSPAA